MSNINYNLNHSAAHVLAEAIMILYPHAKLAIGPAIEDGFYYDVDFGDCIVSTKDFNKIKKTMQKIINQNHLFHEEYKTKTELLNFYQTNPFKTELINNLNQEKLQVVYTGNNFFDLCKGGHTQSTKNIKAFDLLKISAAYWRGKPENPSLTRIYGIAFESQKELDKHLQMLENLKLYDHRKLGHDLCMFTFDSLVGAGLPMWLENGTITRNLIKNFVNQIQIAHGVELVNTPIIGSKELYQTSGHWDHYKENIFPTIKIENKEFVLRPMTCPHHIVLFQKQLWSYKMLPKIYGENALLHRYEHSGGLSGLERVRAMELIDNHGFITHDQIKQTVLTSYNMIKTAIKGFGLKFNRIDLSLNDPEDTEKFINDPQMWKSSESQLKQALDELKIDYVIMKGEAAFYGPKIDFQMETIGKKIITISTIQLDFSLPKRFNLSYIAEDGSSAVPVIIHLGIIGTLERFFALMLEHYKGVLPFWLTPKQIVILPVNLSKHLDFANKLNQKLITANIRSYVDIQDERLAKKIRFAQMQKIPFQIVIGDHEISDTNKINYREYNQTETHEISLNEFIKKLQLLNQTPPIKN